MFKIYKMGVNLSCARHFGKILPVALALFTLTWPTHYTQAKDNPLNRLQTPYARQMTIDAIELIRKGDWKNARDKIARSKDPLASKLFEWLTLINKEQSNWDSLQFNRLTHFIRQNEEWPEMATLKLRAEGVMPENLPEEDVISWFERYPPQTSHGMGRYVDALIATKRENNAKKFLMGWWSNANLSYAQQKRIFNNYSKFLTIEAHKQRFDALLLKGQYQNAMQIANVLGHGYPQLAQARIALAKGKTSGLNELIDRVPQTLQNDPGLLYERLHWRRVRKLDKGALEILAIPLNPAKVQNPEEWWTERHIMIRRLMEKQQYEQAYVLAAGHVQSEGASYAEAQWLAGWLAMRFMNKPTEGYERFSALYGKVNTPISRGRAAYWSGRAAEALGQKRLAEQWYKKASEFQTTFYGQLAGTALSLKDQLPKSKLPHLSQQDKLNYEKSELVQASNIFRSIGMEKRADQFLDAFLSENELPNAYRFAAEMVAESGDYKSAVEIAKQATQKGLFLTKQSYPTITKHLADIKSAEWALIHAIIRQESAFDPKAKSSAGALGLMQLLPSTAKEVSRKMRIGYDTNWLTTKPKYNMILGSAYIARLIKYYDGNYPLAIAAYNAGPGRVDSWIKTYGDPRNSDVDLIDWIELLPIYETRNYVQRVLEGVHVYRLRLDNIQKQPKDHLYVAFQ